MAIDYEKYDEYIVKSATREVRIKASIDKETAQAEAAKANAGYESAMASKVILEGHREKRQAIREYLKDCGYDDDVIEATLKDQTTKQLKAMGIEIIDPKAANPHMTA